MQIDELKAQQAAIDEALLRNRQARSKEVEKCRQIHRRAKSSWNLSRDEIIAILFVYEQCHWSAEPCCRFLEKVARKHRWCKLSDAAMEELLQRLFLESGMADLAAVPTLFADLAIQLQRDARTIMNEWQIVSWGRRANEQHGVPVSTSAIVSKACSMQPVHASLVRGRTANDKPNRQARAWASKFRRRWNARIGKVRQVGNMTTVDMQQKVSGLL